MKNMNNILGLLRTSALCLTLAAMAACDAEDFTRTEMCIRDSHYAGPTSSYIEEKLSTIMGVEQHLLLRIGDTNFYADQLQRCV